MNFKNKVFKISDNQLKGVRGILLDMDNTLYEYGVCHASGLAAAHKYFTSRVDMIFAEFKNRYNLSRKKIKQAIDGTASSHSRLLYFQNFCENYFGKIDIPLTLKLEKTYWDNFFKKMKLFPGTKEFLAGCAKRGIKICLVTDLTAKIQLEKAKHLKIDKYLDFIVSSEEAGKDKPDKAIFLLALKKLKLSRKDIVFIGDDRRRDLAGAKVLNIRSIIV